MTFNFLGPGLTVNVEAKVKEQIILDSSGNEILIVAFVILVFLLHHFRVQYLVRKAPLSLLRPIEVPV